MRCTSYCIADTYDIDSLAKYLCTKGLEPKFYDQVIHIEKINDNENVADIFIFPYGCLTIWGLNEDEDAQILNLIATYQLKPLLHLVRDDCFYHFGHNTEINEENDEIILASDDALIRLAISYALSQSVKLTAFEESIDRTIENTKALPAELAQLGKISLSRRRLSQKIGALFVERNSINLHSNILDTPEFFWRRPQYEHYYHLASNYLDIKVRIEILNKKLAVIHELYDILSNELKHQHSSRLELIIILLIFIEIIFNLIRDVPTIFY